MTIDIEKILFCPIDIKVPTQEVISYCDQFEYNALKFEDYLNCYIIPIFTTDYQWTSHADRLPKLKKWLETDIFTWCKGRTNILCTPPGGQINQHIDCSESEIFFPQHKFRYVLQGNTDSLQFITRTGPIKVPRVNKPFIISGNWPHQMINEFPLRKYTIAVGHPWKADLSSTIYREFLLKNAQKFQDLCLTFDSYDELPENYKTMFRKFNT